MRTKLYATVKWVLALTLVVTGTVVVTASPAAAACRQMCENRPPDYKILIGQYDWYTCADDGYMVKRADSAGMWIGLWYSPRCRTVWAYTTSKAAFFVERQSPYAINWGTVYSYERYNLWTLMLDDAGYVSHACLNYPYGGTICTDWW